MEQQVQNICRKWFLKSKRFWLFILMLSGLAGVVPFEFISPSLEIFGVPGTWLQKIGSALILLSAISKIYLAFKEVPAQLTMKKSDDNVTNSDANN